MPPPLMQRPPISLTECSIVSAQAMSWLWTLMRAIVCQLHTCTFVSI